MLIDVSVFQCTLSNFCLVWSSRVFENRIMRRIFGPKSNENGEWRRVRSVEFHDLYRSPTRVRKSKILRWAGHLARFKESRSAFKVLIGKPTGKRPSGKPRRRWEDNIRMDLKEMGISTRNWVDSSHDRGYWRALVNAAFILLVP
jgi:hypothetical protein